VTRLMAVSHHKYAMLVSGVVNGEEKPSADLALRILNQSHHVCNIGHDAHISPLESGVSMTAFREHF
jgi:hypothetical protein